MAFAPPTSSSGHHQKFWLLTVFFFVHCSFLSFLPACSIDLTQDNRRTFGFRLTPEDNTAIQRVLSLSNSRKLLSTMGDCGAEYR